MEYLKKGDKIITQDFLDCHEICKNLDKEGVEYKVVKGVIVITKGVMDKEIAEAIEITPITEEMISQTRNFTGFLKGVMEHGEDNIT